jgi:transcriptional regulator with XRE-family HTH domain
MKIQDFKNFEEIGTSASYLTQLFRGDRLLNFRTIAKIEAALNIEFKIQEVSVPEKSS